MVDINKYIWSSPLYERDLLDYNGEISEIQITVGGFRVWINWEIY